MIGVGGLGKTWRCYVILAELLVCSVGVSQHEMRVGVYGFSPQRLTIIELLTPQKDSLTDTHTFSTTHARSALALIKLEM